MITFSAVFLIALGLTWLLTPHVIALSRRRGLLDVPLGEAKEMPHQPDAASGRAGHLPAFALALLAAWLLPVQRQDASESVRTLGLMGGAFVIFLLGVWDDARELAPNAPVCCPDIGVDHSRSRRRAPGRVSQSTDGPTHCPARRRGLSADPVLDHRRSNDCQLDRWARRAGGGVVAITAAILALRTLWLGQESVALLPLALLGCCLGFLVFNHHPARIFLGGGAYLLGYLIGAISLFGGPKSATMLLVLAVPIIDVAWRIISRIRSRHLPVYGDRGHLHHRLFDLGLSQTRVVWLYYAVAAFFGLLAVALPNVQTKFAALVVTVIVVGILLYRLSREA